MRKRIRRLNGWGGQFMIWQCSKPIPGKESIKFREQSQISERAQRLEVHHQDTLDTKEGEVKQDEA